MPEFTPEQKEHLKMARRASERISETWNLFTMYLSQGKGPNEALDLAREAVEVWAEWQDNNEVDPPEIERPDFGDEMLKKMGQIMERASSTMGIMTPQGMVFGGSGQVDAEFPAEQPEPASRPTALEPAPASSQQEPNEK